MNSFLSENSSKNNHFWYNDRLERGRIFFCGPSLGLIIKVILNSIWTKAKPRMPSDKGSVKWIISICIKSKTFSHQLTHWSTMTGCRTDCCSPWWMVSLSLVIQTTNFCEIQSIWVTSSIHLASVPVSVVSDMEIDTEGEQS